MPNIPYGSPLDPMRRKAPVRPVGALQPSVDPLAPLPAPVTPVALPAAPSALPKAPPVAKRLNPFDKEHISATLAEISKGFTSSNSFLGGLSGAATNVADATAAWRKAELGTTETGGPDSAFEIHTDQYGNRTYTPIKAVQDYVHQKSEDERRVKNAPKPGESETWIGDAAYGVDQLPAEQRPEAWKLVLAQGKEHGYDVSTAPSEYSPAYSHFAQSRNIGARAGATNEATRAYRQTQAQTAQQRLALTARSTDARIANSNAANARAERKLRAAPPSKSGGLPAGFIPDKK